MSKPASTTRKNDQSPPSKKNTANEWAKAEPDEMGQVRFLVRMDETQAASSPSTLNP